MSKLPEGRERLPVWLSNDKCQKIKEVKKWPGSVLLAVLIPFATFSRSKDAGKRSCSRETRVSAVLAGYQLNADPTFGLLKGSRETAPIAGIGMGQPQFNANL